MRADPIAVELHNTLHATGDRLATAAAARAWLERVEGRARVPARGARASRGQLLELRDAVRAVLHAPADPPAAAVRALNEATRGAPAAPVLDDGEVRLDHGRAGRGAITLAALAADAMALAADPSRLRSCSAPGCVLMFLATDPRRHWCSTACGNRARQARHYARTRASE